MAACQQAAHHLRPRAARHIRACMRSIRVCTIELGFMTVAAHHRRPRAARHIRARTNTLV